MIGETVGVFPRTVSKDRLGNDVSTYGACQKFGGCLVAVAEDNASTGAKRPDGAEPRYTVSFRRGVSLPDMRGARVALLDRGGSADDASEAYTVQGVPDVTPLSPTAWDVTVTVTREVG